MTSPPPHAGAIYLDTGLALAQIGDVEAMNGMLVMLQDALAQDLPLIDAFLRDGDIANANRLLHALKGFVPIFCKAELCAHVVQVEALSKNSQSSLAAPAYLVLKPQLERLLAEVRSYLLSLEPRATP
jgi:HPt (histidine-containing phosphotransfer) domain-containing protein